MSYVTFKIIWDPDKAAPLNIHGKTYLHRKQFTRSVHLILLRIGDSIRMLTFNYDLFNSKPGNKIITLSLKFSLTQYAHPVTKLFKRYLTQIFK